MRAVVVRGFGGPEQLESAEVDEPEEEPGRVLIAVHAAGVNFVDVLVRAGTQPRLSPGLLVPGTELAGTILAVGTGVSDLRPGDRVMAITDGVGAYAELASVAAEFVFPLPDDRSFAEGASFSISFLTAYLALMRRQTGLGDVVLVHVTDGVGMAALQLLRHLGATAIAMASSSKELSLATRIGACVGIDYTNEDLVLRAREETNGRGVDIVLGGLSSPVFSQSLQALAPLGTLILTESPGGDVPHVDRSYLATRSIGIIGCCLRQILRLEPELARQAGQELAELWRNRVVMPRVGPTFPLEEAAAAHRLVEHGRVVDKVVLVVND